jgi:hypothetical protein
MIERRQKKYYYDELRVSSTKSENKEGDGTDKKAKSVGQCGGRMSKDMGDEQAQEMLHRCGAEVVSSLDSDRRHTSAEPRW